MEKDIYFAGGCFWGLEAFFRQVPGVLNTEVGYANGRTENPAYEEVCLGTTGHAETVHVVYDDEKLSLGDLLELFFKVIDPTAVNRQGPDVGNQYRSGIYYTDAGEERVVKEALEELARGIKGSIATEVDFLKGFYPAEEYHQNYLEKNPGGYCHIGEDAFALAKSWKP